MGLSEKVFVAMGPVGEIDAGGSDFTASEAGAQLMFSPGELTKTISIDVLGDTNVEADETFSVILSEPVNATIASGSATGTILKATWQAYQMSIIMAGGGLLTHCLVGLSYSGQHAESRRRRGI